MTKARTATGSVHIRRQIGGQLRGLRDAAGKSRADVVEAKLMSAAKLSKLENGVNDAVRVADVSALCVFYGADDRTRGALEDLTRKVNGSPDWWEGFNDILPGWFTLYLGLESGADRLSVYEPTLVHGLLQTADYATYVYRAAQPDAPAADVERHVDLRLQRQRAVLRLAEDEPSNLITAVLDEGTLTRVVGGEEVMSAQVDHLRGLNQRPNLDVRVLGFGAGAHAGMLGAFAILEFEDRLTPDVVYLESQVGAHYLESPQYVAEYRRVFDLIYRGTVSIEEWQDARSPRMA